MKFFPYAVALLDCGAAAVYLVNRQWALAITWGAYAVAAIALGSVK